MAEVVPLYPPCSCCGGTINAISTISPYQGEAGGVVDPLDNIAETVAGKLFNAKNKGLLSLDLIRGVAAQLLDAVNSGYGHSIIDVDFNSPDFDMLDHLTSNVYHFSAAKNYQQLRDLTSALRDGDRLLSWSEFHEKAKEINTRYNSVWLQTEYEAAVAGSQMASKWNEFEANRKQNPILRYQTVGDSNVREAHRILDGITRHIDDSFWDTHYPPNGWRCRCDAIQLPASTKVTPSSSTPGPQSVTPMFRTNLAKSKLVYPADHPYYNGIPAKLVSDTMRSEVDAYYTDIVGSWITQKVDKSVVREAANFTLGKVKITPAALTSMAESVEMSDKLAVVTVVNALDQFTLVESADAFNAYTLQRGNKTIHLKTKVGTKSEALHTIAVTHS